MIWGVEINNAAIENDRRFEVLIALISASVNAVRFTQRPPVNKQKATKIKKPCIGSGGGGVDMATGINKILTTNITLETTNAAIAITIKQFGSISNTKKTLSRKRHIQKCSVKKFLPWYRACSISMVRACSHFQSVFDYIASTASHSGINSPDEYNIIISTKPNFDPC